MKIPGLLPLITRTRLSGRSVHVGTREQRRPRQRGLRVKRNPLQNLIRHNPLSGVLSRLKARLVNKAFRKY